MTDEKETTDDLDDGYLRLPRKLRLPVLATMIVALLGAPSWMTSMELRAQAQAKELTALTAAKDQEDEKLDNISKKLCLMCLILTDRDACLDKNICDLGQIGTK